MKPFYRFAKIVATLMMKLGGARIIGQHNLPPEGALLIACNHVSYGDPPAITWAYPYQITYIAKEEFAAKWWTRKLFGWLGAVFLKKGESDLGAMRTAMKELHQGKAVAIFPEGTRHLDQQLGPFQPGAAFISCQSKTPVLPMAVLNTGDFFRIWKRNQLVLVGDLIEPPAGQHLDRQAMDEYCRLIQQRVSDLVEQGKAQLAAEGRPMRVTPKKYLCKIAQAEQ